SCCRWRAASSGSRTRGWPPSPSRPSQSSYSPRPCWSPPRRCASSDRSPTLAPALPRPAPRRRDPTGPGPASLLPVGRRPGSDSASAEPGKQVVLGQRRVRGVVHPDEALRSHEGGEQLLAHLQEEDV